TPNGYKVTILLEELGFDYNVVLVHIGKGEQFRPDFLKISPNNKIPVLVDHGGPDGKPFALFESGAIMMYLAEKAGWQFMPSDRRHGGLSLAATAQMAGPGYRGVAEPAALVQRRARAARRAAWARSHGGSARQEAGKAVRRILGRSIRPKTIRGALIASDRSCNSNCRC